MHATEGSRTEQKDLEINLALFFVSLFGLSNNSSFYTVIVKDMRPLSLVEGEAFLDMIEYACPGFKCPSRWKIETTYDEDRNNVCIFTAALDPRFRKLKFLSTDDILKVKIKLQTLALEARRVQVREEPEEDDSPSGQPDHSRQKPNSILDTLLGRDDDEELEDEDPGQDQSEDAVRNELLVYFGEKPIPKDKNPLQWWKENETKFPALAVVAKSYLAAPATSTPSERLFSAAGTIVSKKRASLTKEHVDMLTFLHSNSE
ncbi:putative zinc finger BED domain-containing protein 1-like [Triplophysa rosa]|uniref:Zinc finger BED domain-containing protein 1-like n=1 Tax=Triplophysa rosa TaxID=992332 RepID=A0A9W7TB09_TRIRA|nr:putative zinc finger BED domain-containing protein 1-like [Triplophysa rosa]